MAEKTPPTDQQPEMKESASTKDAAGTAKRQRSGTATLIVVLLLLGAAAGGAYHFRVLDRFIPPPTKPAAEAELAPVLTHLSPDNSPSSSELLADLGKSPADPSRVLFPAFDKTSDASSSPKGKSCPPGSVRPAGTDTPAPDAGSATTESAPLGTQAATEGMKETSIAPVITSRVPGESSTQDKPGKKKTAGKKSRESVKKSVSEEPPSSDEAKQEEPAKEAKGTEDRAAEASGPTGTAGKAKDILDQKRPEQFQLPGSLVVKIQGYGGTTSKWALMVVLDDSHAMAKRTRIWQPDRLQTGVDFIAKLPDALPPNSRLAVRDFMCPQADGSKKGPAGTCPSHMVYDWADNPFKGLKDKLQNVQPGGATDPCGAAAYAVRKDMAGMKNQIPRLLLVTSGAGKCSAKELLHALDAKTGNEHPRVDVLALGMAKKRAAPYAAITRKSNGLLLKVDRPTDVDQVLARYGKVLKTKAREKIEVRSDKAVFTSALDEELTLPPGSYTITLPPVAGLDASRRVIPNVKVGSGEAKVVEVPLKKGRAAARSGKK